MPDRIVRYIDRKVRWIERPSVILLIVIGVAFVQIESSQVSTDVSHESQARIEANHRFLVQLCEGSNAARVELNKQSIAIASFLHESIALSKAAQRLQPQTSNPPELKQIRLKYRMALGSLFKSLHPVKLTKCGGSHG